MANVAVHALAGRVAQPLGVLSTGLCARFRVLGPALLFLAVAAAMMLPYAGDRLRETANNDLAFHLANIVDARNALAEGQFPIRISPSYREGVRYPIYQFYGNFPYTAPALLSRLSGVSAYTAWKLMCLACLTVSALYVYRMGYRATRRARPALVAGLVFITAPYMWADLHARFAYPEFVAFNMLPVAAFYATRCFASRRPVSILCGAVAWALVSLSHNVAYLYLSAYLGLYFLLHARPSRKYMRRMLRVGVAYALGAVLVLWFVAPQRLVVPDLVIRMGGGAPAGAESLTPLKVLLWPWLRNPDASGTPRLGLQAGWLVLASAAVAAFHVGRLTLLRAAGRKRPPGTGTAARLLVVFAMALFMAWSPVDFWHSIPRVFSYVLSSYRLLMFSTLFGAMLTPYALAWAFRRGGMTRRHVLIALAVVGAASVSYVPRHRQFDARAMARMVDPPRMAENSADYLLHTEVTSAASPFVPGVNWARPVEGLLTHGALAANAPVRAHLPAPLAGAALAIEGTTFPEYTRGTLTINWGGKLLPPTEVGPGEFRLSLPLPEADPSARAVPLELKIERILDPPATAPTTAPPTTAPPTTSTTGPTTAPEPDLNMALKIPLLTITAPAHGADGAAAFVPLAEARRRTRLGKVTVYESHDPRPTRVHLPVLYYAKLLRVRDNGRDVDYGNLGRMVALELSPGPHRVEIRYAGVPWADAASLAGWAIVAAGGVALVLRRVWLRRGRRRRSAQTRRPPPIPPRELLWGGLVVFVLIGAIPLYDIGGAYPRSRGLDYTATATSVKDDEHAPELAFDGDDNTEWHAAGHGPCTLTVIPRKPIEFKRVALIARRTLVHESWHRVRLEAYFGGKLIHAQDHYGEDADRRRRQVMRLPSPVRADRIVLHFSEPVTLARDHYTRVDPAALTQGYAEIEFK